MLQSCHSTAGIFFLSWPCIFFKSWPHRGVLMKWWIGFCPTRERQLNISYIKFRETKTYPMWSFLDKSASDLYIFNDNVVSSSVLFNTKSKLTHGEKYCLILFSPHFPPYFRVSACAIGGGLCIIRSEYILISIRSMETQSPPWPPEPSVDHWCLL